MSEYKDQVTDGIDQLFDRMADRCTRLGRENAILRARILADQSAIGQVVSAKDRVALCEAYAVLSESQVGDDVIEVLDKVICFFGGHP